MERVKNYQHIKGADPDEQIPVGIWFNAMSGGFYSVQNRREQGQEFFCKWIVRWTEFPQNAAIAEIEAVLAPVIEE